MKTVKIEGQTVHVQEPQLRPDDAAFLETAQQAQEPLTKEELRSLAAALIGHEFALAHRFPKLFLAIHAALTPDEQAALMDRIQAQKDAFSDEVQYRLRLLQDGTPKDRTPDTYLEMGNPFARAAAVVEIDERKRARKEARSHG